MVHAHCMYACACEVWSSCGSMCGGMRELVCVLVSASGGIAPHSQCPSPVVQDPDVGNKGILKNLDKYTNTDWKAKAGLKEDGTPAKKAAPANKGAPAPAVEAEEE